MIAFDCSLARQGFKFEAAFAGDEGVLALFGPSGSGKSTALRLIAGLEQPDRGTISLGSRVLLDSQKSLFVPPSKRRIGLVFQDAQLFPHLSVRSNLLYGQWFTSRVERRISLKPVVDVLGIGQLLKRRCNLLSGGEKQRVAIGRALLSSPRLLLMDEPLASLDANRKLEILPFIEDLRDEFRIPIVYVSHAVEEVARLAKTVVMLDHGKVKAMGTPSEVLATNSALNGAGRFEVASVLGGNIARHMPDYGVTIISHPAGEIVVPGKIQPQGRTVRVTVHAANVTIGIGHQGTTSVRTSLRGRIGAIDCDTGPFALVTIVLTGDDVLRACVTRLAVDELGLRQDAEVSAIIKAVSIDESGISGVRSSSETK